MTPFGKKETILFPFLVTFLFMIRLLIPTEASVSGDTLLLSQCWLGVAVLWFYLSGYRLATPWNWTLFDSLTWCIVLGHVISALVVLINGGDQRAAVNMAWEWVSLGVTVFLLRRVLTSSQAHQQFLLCLLLCVLPLACLGWWQHWVWYPSISQEYQSVRAELDELRQSSEPLTVQQSQRIRSLELQLVQQGVPLQGRERVLWEQRLYNSREPFGTFALANTFAGLLLVGFMFAVGLGVSQWKVKAGNRTWILPVLSVGLIGGCLLLTKSRTAWVGLFCGLCVLWLSASRFQAILTRQQLMWLVTIAVIVTLSVGAFLLLGGLDREVLTEAPRSLKFRLQYWQGTAEILLRHPIFGTGLGNFRDHYLRFKLPESSEEIADPHNFLLDLWCSGGLLAIGSFLGLMGWSLYRFLQQPHPLGEPMTEQTIRTGFRDPIVLGAIGSFAGIFAWELLIGGAIGRWGLLLLGVVVAVWLSTLVSRIQFPPMISLAALMGLLVHLLGAGGIEMPAITQIVLLLGLFCANPSQSVISQQDIPHRTRLVPVGVAVAAFLGCLWTATLPVLQRQALMTEGDFLLISRKDFGHARKAYLSAAEADPLSTKPHERLAGLALEQWRNQEDNSSAFSQFEESAQQVMTINPNGHQGYEQWGLGLLEKARQSEDPEDAQQSIVLLNRAVERYPSSIPLQIALARAYQLDAQREEAATHARIALQLDELNHQEGHSDKYLSEESIQELQEMVKSSTSE